MSKAKIYVPGKNDFLDWARKMNKNAELDMKKATRQNAVSAQSVNNRAQGTVSGANTPVANSQTSRESGGKYDDQRT